MMEQVVQRKNMFQALYREEQNKDAAGVDGVGAKELRPYLREHWPQVREELLEGAYNRKPVRWVEIPKPDGGVKLLGIPTVLDRPSTQGSPRIVTALGRAGAPARR
ncbi:MAG: hypothetical protein ACOZCF_13765 [Bacillota bacterium]